MPVRMPPRNSHARRFARRMGVNLFMVLLFSLVTFFFSGSIVGSLLLGGVFLLYLLQDIYFDYIDTKRRK